MLVERRMEKQIVLRRELQREKRERRRTLGIRMREEKEER